MDRNMDREGSFHGQDEATGAAGAEAGGGAGAHAGGAPVEGRAARMEGWDRLSDLDLEEAGGTPKGLIGIMTDRLEVSKREAKRQLRDAMRVVRAVEKGAATGGKQMRRIFERSGREVGSTVARGLEGVQDLLRVLSAGGLAGRVFKRLPLPEPEQPPAQGPGSDPSDVAGSGAAEPAGERAEAS